MVLDHLYALSELYSSRRRHRQDGTTGLARLKVVERGNTVMTSWIGFFVTCHVSLPVTCSTNQGYDRNFTQSRELEKLTHASLCGW